MIMHATNTTLALPHASPLHWKLDAEQVQRATATLPQPERDALLWLDDHGRRNNLTLAELGGRLQKASGGCYSKDTVYQVLTGRETSIAVFINAVQRFRATVIESPDEFPFVLTTLARSIFDYADLCRAWHKMGLVIGESQTGKSRSLREYARLKSTPQKPVLYFQMPEGGHKSKVVDILCDLLDLPMNTHARRELALTRAVTKDMLIIPDEIQQCASRTQSGGRSKTERVGTIEFLRRLRDVTRCSILFSGTTEALQMLQGTGVGHENGHIFIQTLKRSLDPYVLRNRPVRRDLNAFAAHVGLPAAQGEAQEKQDLIAEKRGLEMWLTYLLAGAQRAAKEQRPITWPDVLAAIAIFTQAGGES
jgi:hypothetical protein